jgi:hypothetical protein
MRFKPLSRILRQSIDMPAKKVGGMSVSVLSYSKRIVMINRFKEKLTRSN